MRVAIPNWQGRVSPVFDVAGKILLVDVSDGREQARREVTLDADEPQRRANALAELGTDVLVCGVISWPFETALAVAGVKVIPHICGDVERVLAALTERRLGHEAFLMPGCRGRRRRFRGRRRRGWPGVGD